MLVGGVVDDEVDEDAHAALIAGVGELDEVAEGAVAGIDVVVVGDVVAVVAHGRGLEGHEPDGGDAEALEVVEAAHEAAEVADAVAVGVHEGADVEAVEDGVLVPEVVNHVACVPGAYSWLGCDEGRDFGWRSSIRPLAERTAFVVKNGVVRFVVEGTRRGPSTSLGANAAPNFAQDDGRLPGQCLIR